MTAKLLTAAACARPGWQSIVYYGSYSTACKGPICLPWQLMPDQSCSSIIAAILDYPATAVLDAAIHGVCLCAYLC